MRTACFIAILICLSCCKHSHMEMQNGKDFDTKLEELILFEKKINQEYYLKVDVPKEVLEYRLTYMGSVENNEKESLILFILLNIQVSMKIQREQIQ